jgi:hypothetical protein
MYHFKSSAVSSPYQKNQSPIKQHSTDHKPKNHPAKQPKREIPATSTVKDMTLPSKHNIALEIN